MTASIPLHTLYLIVCTASAFIAVQVIVYQTGVTVSTFFSKMSDFF
jgi:hypothetical protein